MKIEKLTEIYYSPTSSTKKIINQITDRMNAEEVRTIDLTDSKICEDRNLKFDKNELIVVGVPCYNGSAPNFILGFLKKLKANNNLVILVSSFGNVSAGQVLQQMQKILQDNNFKVIGAGAFAAQHSFYLDDMRIGENRPDNKDYIKIDNFADELISKINTTNELSEFKEVTIEQTKKLNKTFPKNYDVPDIGSSVKILIKTPTRDIDKCTKCMKCANSCPVGAIDKTTLEINKDICTRCFRCVNVCPEDALDKTFISDKLVKALFNKIGGSRKEPSIYL